jgi:hypothetical protein
LVVAAAFGSALAVVVAPSRDVLLLLLLLLMMLSEHGANAGLSRVEHESDPAEERKKDGHG